MLVKGAWVGKGSGKAKAKKVEMPFIELYKFLYIDSDCLFCPANCSCVGISFSCWPKRREIIYSISE